MGYKTTPIDVRTYRETRADLIGRFSSPAKIHDLLFWALNQLRTTARTMDLMNLSDVGTSGESQLSLEHSIPDLTADVIEGVLRHQGYDVGFQGDPHWFDEKPDDVCRCGHMRGLHNKVALGMMTCSGHDIDAQLCDCSCFALRNPNGTEDQ